MKFTLSWLKEHLDTTASLAEIRDTLTMRQVGDVEIPQSAFIAALKMDSR